MARSSCPVCGAAHETCVGVVGGPYGPGIVIEMAMLATGAQIAEERIFRPRADNPDVLELAYVPGDVIADTDVVALGIVDGRVVAPDLSDTSPTEKARRRAQNKAVTDVENKAVA